MVRMWSRMKKNPQIDWAGGEARVLGKNVVGGCSQEDAIAENEDLWVWWWDDVTGLDWLWMEGPIFR